MRYLTAALVLALATPAFADAPILGGTQATVGQYPTTVGVEVGQGGTCTGTLIAPDWVLTAAHCLTPSVIGEPDQTSLTQSVRVHLNTVNFITTPGEVVTASETIPDPLFNVNDLGHNDSGLIHLAHTVTDVQPQMINGDVSRAPVGIVVTQVGFGTTLPNAGGSVDIEYGVTGRTSVGCAQYSGGGATLSDANLLCFSQTDSKGKCEGDSGGPSFATINGNIVEVGITSFGDGACTQYGADTRVDAEIKFIRSHAPVITCKADSDCAMGHECFANDCILTPFTMGGLGFTCTAGSDCESGTCTAGDGTMKCSQTCAVGQANTCPSGFDCLAANNATTGACWPSSGGGCCDSSGHGAPTAALGIALCTLVLRRRKR